MGLDETGVCIGVGACGEAVDAGTAGIPGEGVPWGAAPGFSPDRLGFDQAVAIVRREWIAHAMKKHRGIKTRVAEELGVDRKTLNSMIKRLGL